MRILQVSSAKSFGGGEKHLLDLTHGLAARGHEVFLAASPKSPLGKRTGLPPENILTLSLRGALDITAARQLSAAIQENKIDIVHAHMARDYFPVSLAVRLAPQTKFVLTRHVLFPMKTLHRFALSNVSRVIAVSEAVEKQLREQRIFAGEKIVRIPNGIDVKHWAGASHDELRRQFRDGHNIPQTAPLVGTVGELKKLKGQEDLILAAELILQQFPETRFILVGGDNSANMANIRGGEYKKHLLDLAAAIGAPDRFIWLDEVADTAPLLHSLDVFVSASHSESFGLAILEAMASGGAIVATATEGAKELLGGKGLVPIEDASALAKAVCSFLSDENKRAETGRAYQEIAAKNFDIKKMIDAVEKLYKELKGC